MKKLRFGLIGFSQGHYATNYTRALLCRPEVELVACCDLGASPSYVQECAFTTAEESAVRWAWTGPRFDLLPAGFGW